MVKPWTLDFETEAIDGHIPPEPVGLAVKAPDWGTTYYSWGHPDSPNPYSDQETAKNLCLKLMASNQPIVFHNMKFDIGVMQYHWGIGPRDWTQMHDTMFLLFLNNPYSTDLALKPSSEELLNWEAEEQDDLHNWIMQHIPEATKATAGAYIAKAPHKIVERYAAGDVDRTRALFDMLYPLIVEDGDMLEAYQREQRLVPILHESELRGVRIDRERLEEDLHNIYEPALGKVEDELRSRLSSPGLDFGKKDELADALESAGFVDEWIRTKTGRRSTSKENLERAINDPLITNLLRYRGAMAGVLQTFGRPWVEDSERDGRLHTSWNQVRTRGSHDQGTRTGRLSASRPNLMNIPNELRVDMPDGYPDPPFMRRYMLPEEKHVWCKRDFSSQEVRILGHFEDGDLMKAYQQDPELDPHGTIQRGVMEITGREYDRKDIKITVFLIIYGGGVGALASQIGCSYDEAKSIRDAVLRAYPAIRSLQRQVTKTGDDSMAVYTWGGRRYFAEPSITSGGKTRKFSYKLLNYLIQGSAADQTKDCIIDWNASRSHNGEVFLATVHDEINISVHKDHWENGMAELKSSMDRDLFDVPMRSEGFVGPNWFDMKESD